MSNNWTPGPWALAMIPALELKGQVVKEPWPFRENDGSHIIVSDTADDEKRGRVATASYRGSERKSLYQASDPEGLANARLIAAAPEYDSVLGEMLAEIAKFHPTFDANLFVKAERLRKKARGE